MADRRASWVSRATRCRWPVWCGTLALLGALLLTGCGGQTQRSDPRLRYFKVISSRILIEGNQAQVSGVVSNTSTLQFPFDVTMHATLLDLHGQTVGTATGTAEDVGPGQLREFQLQGTVDGTRYASLTVVPVSLAEKRQELNWPTPTPFAS